MGDNLLCTACCGTMKKKNLMRKSLAGFSSKRSHKLQQTSQLLCLTKKIDWILKLGKENSEYILLNVLYKFLKEKVCKHSKHMNLRYYFQTESIFYRKKMLKINTFHSNYSKRLLQPLWLLIDNTPAKTIRLLIQQQHVKV